jgi:hypothetical protein
LWNLKSRVTAAKIRRIKFYVVVARRTEVAWDKSEGKEPEIDRKFIESLSGASTTQLNIRCFLKSCLGWRLIHRIKWNRQTVKLNGIAVARREYRTARDAKDSCQKSRWTVKKNNK